MEFNIKVTKDNIIEHILILLNFHLKLSDLEIEILSVILKNKMHTIDISARDTIRKVLNKDKFTTNNYIKRLKEKKIILQDNKKLYINPSVIALVANEVITFKFIL